MINRELLKTETVLHLSKLHRPMKYYCTSLRRRHTVAKLNADGHMIKERLKVGSDCNDFKAFMRGIEPTQQIQTRFN